MNEDTKDTSEAVREVVEPPGNVEKDSGMDGNLVEAQLEKEVVDIELQDVGKNKSLRLSLRWLNRIGLVQKDAGCEMFLWQVIRIRTLNTLRGREHRLRVNLWTSQLRVLKVLLGRICQKKLLSSQFWFG